MALSAVEALLIKARNATQEDVDQLCKSISEMLAFPERSSECSALLRKLFVLLQASDAEQYVPRKLVSEMLQSVIRLESDKIGAKQCMLCRLILKELLPDSGEQVNPSLSPSPDNPPRKSFLPFFLLQGSRNNCVEQVLPAAVRWLCTKDFDSQRKALSFLVGVTSLHNIITQEYIGETSEELCAWLMNASLYQAPNPYTFNLFRKDEESQVTEIDGTPCRNIFTILNISQYYTDDQYLNIYSFSLLYKWLHSCAQHVEDTIPKANPEENPEIKDTNKKKTITAKVLQSLVTRSVDYCFRVMDQCERKTKVTTDSELQFACLTEVVSVLDIACHLDPGQVPRVHQEMRRLYTRLSSETANSSIVVHILQFFLNHSSAVVHDPQEAYDHFFGTMLGQQFKDSGVAFDTVNFLYQNLETLCYRTNIFSRFFPNILKLLAWHPRTFVNEFVNLLPAMMTPTTSLEIFHTVLDLPCMTAALEVMEKAKKVDQATLQGGSKTDPSSSVETFHMPLYKPLFSFICRSEGGQGDTIDKLSSLHQVLEDARFSARVVCCSQTIPLLIRVWFEVVLEEADQNFAVQLLPVLLERSDLLFGIPEYKADIKRILSEQVMQFLDRYPSLIVSQAADIMEFIHITRNITNCKDFYGNLVFAIGEYCSPQRADGCTPELVASYFDLLEVMTYEICGKVCLEEDVESSPKILCHLMSALAKLSTRRQDLIPRAILCLTKVAKHSYTLTQDSLAQGALMTCAQEHINLLKMPNFAVTVLNPSAEIYTGRWHRDSTSLPSMLRGIIRLMKRHP